MSIVPPASATLIWAFPTKFEEVRCFVWEFGPAGWAIAVMFGNDTLAFETAPTRRAMEAGVDLVWRGLLSSGLGRAGADDGGPHTAFRHQDASSDSESSNPSTRRRPH